MAINIFFSLLLVSILILITLEDIKTMLISENKLRLFAISGIIYLTSLGFSSEKINCIDLIFKNSISMLIIFLIMYIVSYISYKLFRINSLGLGDIKLSSISTLWLGLELSFISLCISFLISAIYSLHSKLTKKFKLFHQYPFAPFLSIGIFCSWFLDKL